MKRKGVVIALLLAVLCVLTGCGREAEKAAEPTTKISLQEKVKAVAKDAADLAPLDSDDLTDALGAEPEDYTEFVYLQETGFGGREILAIRAKDTATADRLEKQMERYLDRRRSETWDYAPAAYELLSKAEIKRKNLLLVMISGEEGTKETEQLLAGE